METIRLINYRCFKDTGCINLKPINLLLGANSSGKSSILKFFPLLKQSMGVRLNGVFRWLGNDVDFKDFNNTVLRGADELKIEYTIEKLPLLNRISSSRMTLNNVVISFTIVSKNLHFDRMTHLSCRFGDTEVDIFYDEGKATEIIVNGESTKQLNGLEISSNRVDATFERLYFKYKGNSYSHYPSIYMDRIMQITKNIDGVLSQRKNHRIFEIFPFDYNSFKKGVYSINKKEFDESIVQALYKNATIYNINVLIDSLNIYLIRHSENIFYVKPLRATIERYYRFQNLDLNDIDSDGTNLPMFLYNLPNFVLDELCDWLRNFFNLDLKIKPLEGHIELLISENTKDYRNPVDLGFGYTQLLPILVIVWKAIFIDAKRSTSKKKFFPNTTILIEQPELHLHPRYQKRFATMLAAMVVVCQKLGLHVKFIVETHSESILNSLGESVEDELISAEDINVLLVEQESNGISSVVSTTYTKEGYLKNWPRHFLEDAN